MNDNYPILTKLVSKEHTALEKLFYAALLQSSSVKLQEMSDMIPFSRCLIWPPSHVSSTEPDQSKQSAVPTDKSAKKTKYVRPKPQKKASQATFSHSWLAGTLKGHSARVLGFDFSANGKYLISAAEGEYIEIVFRLFSEKWIKFCGIREKWTCESNALWYSEVNYDQFDITL